MDILNLDSYTSQTLETHISELKNTYPFLEISSIGVSNLGVPIQAIRFGRGTKEILYVGATHANELITAPLLMTFLEVLCNSYINGLSVYGQNPRMLFNAISLYVVPMLNPDGVDLVQEAIPKNSESYQRAVQIANNYPNIAFPSGWKANIYGVDINLQFPAGWEQAKQIKYAQGFTSPAPRDFVGYSPLSTPEARAIYNFILNHNFRLMLTYHTQGEVIYWQYQNYAPSNSLEIANTFAANSGYAVADVPFNSNFAGLKDWYLFAYRRPGFTIEAGSGTNPLPLSDLNNIFEDNFGILVLGMVK